MSIFDLPNTTETLTPMGAALPFGTTRQIIADGARGTAQTIALMQKLVNTGKRSIKVRKVCGDAIAPCKSKDYYDYAKKAYEWVRKNIKYAYDPNLVEFLESSDQILSTKIGDCDSMDILLCSMFENLGFQSQFVTIKADVSRPDEFTHVYTRVMVPKVGWINADPIMPDKYFGWEAPFPDGRRYWHASTDELNMPLDTSPSVETNDMSSTGPTSFAGIGHGGPNWDGRRVGTEGLGHGHHHGGGRRGGYGYGYPYWGGGFDDNVYVLPVVIGSSDAVQVVPGENILMQQLERPQDERQVGVGFLGLDSLGADSGWQEPSSGIIQGIEDFLSGRTQQRINDGYKEYQRHLRALDSLRKAARTSGPKQAGAQKVFDTALALLRREWSAWNDACAAYVRMLDGLKTAASALKWISRFGSLGFSDGSSITSQIPWPALELPPGLGCSIRPSGAPNIQGLGAFVQIAGGAAIVVAGIVAAAYLLSVYNEKERIAKLSSSDLSTYYQQHGGVGIFDDFKRVLESGATVLKEGGSAGLKIGLVIGGAFVLYKLVESFGGRRAAV